MNKYFIIIIFYLKLISSAAAISNIDARTWILIDYHSNEIIHEWIYKTNIIGCTQNNAGRKYRAVGFEELSSFIGFRQSNPYPISKQSFSLCGFRTAIGKQKHPFDRWLKKIEWPYRYVRCLRSADLSRRGLSVLHFCLGQKLLGPPSTARLTLPWSQVHHFSD